jgi:glycogen phosphorylase
MQLRQPCEPHRAGDDVEQLRRYCTAGAASATRHTSIYERHLRFDNVTAPEAVDTRERFEAFARSVRDFLSERWLCTEQTYGRLHPKRVYYLSMEFLIGRQLANNVTNLLLTQQAGQLLRDMNVDWIKLVEEEPDAGLGSGGLGRLAACFLDSLATLQIPAMGYGLRYEYGMFRQEIVDGWQRESPDNWLRRPDPWEVARPNEAVSVGLGCSFAVRGGRLELIPHRPSRLVGIPFDRPVVGFGGETVGTLRLWGAAAPDYFDLHAFSSGDLIAALAETLAAETLTRVLYPDDSTPVGRELRFVQEYFLVACSIADLVRRFRSSNLPWRSLPEKAAVQLNDTHPALAVPELLRTLLDDAGLSWDLAWDITQRTLSYTNHTLLPEALERWPVTWFKTLLPRHLEIIYEVNRRLLDDVRERFPNDGARIERMSLIEEGAVRQVRMAHMAIVGSHSTNGVSVIHSELLRSRTVRDFAEMFPQRFNNKTNGVTPRRWLLLANPGLSAAITAAIGNRWTTDLDELRRLAPLSTDSAFQQAVQTAKQSAKDRLASWLREACGVIVDPKSIFDCHIKRIHEYKRQLLNALRIVTLYQRLRAHPQLQMPARTFIFAGKAAPAYHLAKLIIKFINNLAATIDADEAVRGRLKVVFVPEYRVSLAERLIPAADVSNQISTAGFEASGTSNMKFMMNGALTLGTRDGATIEMSALAGEENFFLFGLNAQQVAESRGWYRPQWHYENDPEARAALDAIRYDTFSAREPGIFRPIFDALLSSGDYYFHLADLQSYLAADQRIIETYQAHEAWTRMAILNVAASGQFSSDRAIAQYAAEIWRVIPCQVAQESNLTDTRSVAVSTPDTAVLSGA